MKCQAPTRPHSLEPGRGPSCPDVALAAFLAVTDLHQQGADHRVDAAHLGDGGHLVATQYVSLQRLRADLHVHLTCAHTHAMRYPGSGAALISVTFCVRRQNRFSVCFSANYPPSLPPFPIAFALINPHLLSYYTASPPLSSFLRSPHSFTQRTSTDHPPRETFLRVSSEILPDLLVQVIVSIPLRGRQRGPI